MISLLGGTIYESDIPIKKNSKCLCERERERRIQILILKQVKT